MQVVENVKTLQRVVYKGNTCVCVRVCDCGNIDFIQLPSHIDCTVDNTHTHIFNNSNIGWD